NSLYYRAMRYTSLNIRLLYNADYGSVGREKCQDTLAEARPGSLLAGRRVFVVSLLCAAGPRPHLRPGIPTLRRTSFCPGNAALPPGAVAQPGTSSGQACDATGPGRYRPLPASPLATSVIGGGSAGL